jgi:hypothetical protein
MTSDSLANWNQPDYAREYRDQSDYYIPFRPVLVRILVS